MQVLTVFLSGGVIMLRLRTFRSYSMMSCLCSCSACSCCCRGGGDGVPGLVLVLLAGVVVMLGMVVFVIAVLALAALMVVVLVMEPFVSLRCCSWRRWMVGSLLECNPPTIPARISEPWPCRCRPRFAAPARFGMCVKSKSANVASMAMWA